MKDRLLKPPATEQLIEPIHQLLDYLDAIDRQDGDGWSTDLPQVAALRDAFLSRRAGRDLAHHLWKAQEEEMFGPFPQFGSTRHPNREHWYDVLDEIENLALRRTTKNAITAEAEYASLRHQLLADKEISRHLPPSLKSATTLADLHKQLNDISNEADSPQTAQFEFLADDFRPLRWWLNGRCPFGSPEWLAQETWLVVTALDRVAATMSRVIEIREVVEGSGVQAVRSTRWRRFVLKHFGSGAIVRALEVGWASLMATEEALELDADVRRLNDVNLNTRHGSN